MNREPDWTLWRSFAAVVDKGSLSGAARHLGLSQPTLGRHIETLEVSLGTALFDRTLGGFRPNERGAALYDKVHAAELQLAEAWMQAAGSGTELGGTVRITASRVISHYVLPRLLLPIRQQHPAIEIELVPSDTTENLLLRDADIAVRMFRPSQLDLVTRHLGDIPIVPAAHRSYLDRRGRPAEMNDLAGHDLLGFDASDAIIVHAQRLGAPLKRSDFLLRTDDQPLLWELMVSGHGIGFGQRNLVLGTPGMEELPIPLGIPPLPIWLTAHRELFTNRAIRATFDALAAGLEAYIKGDSD